MSDDVKKILFEKLNEKQKKQIDEMAEKVKLAIALVMRLRGEEGCPWDLEQDHHTLRSYLVEEAYETLDVLDQIPAKGPLTDKHQSMLKEEIGDVLLQTLLHTQFTAERGEFDFGDMAKRLAEKLVFRHPHVFGEEKARSVEDVLENWETLKKKEGKKGVLDGLPKSLPSLQRAWRMGEKVQKVGFDWRDIKGPKEKVYEELKELEAALESNDQKEIEHELGDVFFSLCNLSRHLKLNPEEVHRKAIERFEGRFRGVEKLCEERSLDMKKMSLEELDSLWEEVKQSK
jgi:tetrapyrrole methylase family protein/MazG family protein